MTEITKQALSIGWHHPAMGGISTTNLDALQNLCNKVITEGIMIADVGCWTGLSTVGFGLLVKPYHGKVKAIDLFQGSPYTGLEQVAKEADVYSVCKANMRYFELEDTVEIIKKDSAFAAQDYPNESFDYVFIDADHRYPRVLNDIDAWWPKVKKGGILSGHDCEFIVTSKTNINMFEQVIGNPWNDVDQLVMHLGVIRAVSQRFGDVAQLEDGLIWWVQK